MPERAHLTSVEALETFRASLIVYLSKAGSTLEDVSGELVRTRVWLQHDRRVYWENELRRRSREMERAQQALFGAKMSALRQASDAEQAAVRRARRSLDEAEMKLKRVKQWSREFDNRVEPLAKKLDHLRSLLAADLPRGAAYLSRTIKTLADYAGISAALSSDIAASPHDPGSPTSSGPSPGADDAPPSGRDSSNVPAGKHS